MVRARHRLPAVGGALSEPLRQRRPLDVRVGSTTNALAPVSVAERRLAATATHWAALAAIVGAAVFADQLTKHIVSSELALDEGVHVIGPFWIRHVENPGIAFGLFASATTVVILLTTLAVAWMLAYFGRSGARHPVLPVALGLVMGGSISNLLDRVRLGHVVDFLDPRFGPAFNLADSFIVVGVAVLLYTLLADEHAPRRPRSVDGAASG